MSEDNEQSGSLSSNQSQELSSQESKSSSEEFGGLELFNSDEFDPNDYDDYELTVIYHNTICDLFEQMKEFKTMYDEKLKNYQEMLRHSTQNETKLKQHVSQAQEIIKELKEGYDKSSKSFNEITEAYQNEQIAHNKTLQELNELKLAQKTMCSNMTVCAAVEIVIKNGKVTGLNMKESLDATRDDAMMQLNLMTRKVDELRRELTATKVETTKSNEEVEKERKNSQELMRKIELMKTESINLQNDIKLKDNEIEELKKKIEEDNSLQKKITSSREQKIRSIIEKKKSLRTNRRLDRPQLISSIISDIVKTDDKTIQNTTEGFDNPLASKQIQTSNRNAFTPIIEKSDSLSTVLNDTNNGLFSKSSSSCINPLSALSSNTSSGTYSSTLHPPLNSLLSQTDSKSKIFKGKKSSSKLLSGVLDSTNSDIILSDRNISDVGIIEDGIVIVYTTQEGSQEVSLLKHKTFVPEFSLDIDVKYSTQTSFGFCVASNNSIVLLSRVNKTYEIKGITNIGQSQKGILVLNESGELTEIVDDNKKLIGTLPCKVDGNIFMVDDLIIFKDKEDRLVTYLPKLKNICYCDHFVKQVIVVNHLIYSIDKENPNKIYIYNLNLTMKLNKLIQNNIKRICNFGEFIVAVCANSAFVVNEKTVKPLISLSYEIPIITITFSIYDKKVYLIVVTNNQLLKIQTDLHVHELKEYKDNKHNPQCSLCSKPMKKGKKCKRCGICFDVECAKTYAGQMESWFIPCLEQN
ncbi:hypothetical protein EHI8A_100850 [Entamoeba histolytica HM-1:IMSS-B]|uniref:Uncharacterized protein n=6 Tax=Entamoeba histolytica TaxID=5759 RepID=C4M337_ENTH1|nr:hypothetical protein EHI_059660 [Entamoeba histolytica HM-1:IMSS]EMD44105.1 Hypothetical protein EHI5A_146480 [Entamoeba histolytica KU27]EMH75448.1 hypothetical protein EHI8A_100850 [Entamoeba histolytica HM-1:IMSS-B]EMS11918.1 hypothetical protein KM1_177350 [Entamoeba histolytica HM-3:IMSS]ENY62450.1 hypothetical protein EHI7A_098470 [Entamoeba histolytica HM-1:IMSS-A]GAT95714.1 hypothetical protein CL6EHI_059660 [Entamoeba histolytica]|eukprot:XP_652888.1 hypothetical protein EHI_059660 [Entamoeba histolytica HM-1:IMSS]